MKNNPNKTSSQLNNASPGIGTSNCPKSDSLLFLIHKIEVLTDWLQNPPLFRKILNYSVFIPAIAALIWGAFFVPSDILLKSPAARSWVDVATTLFPWIAKLEVNWGERAHKQMYLQTVFILVMALPMAIDVLSAWKVRVDHRSFFKKLDKQIWAGLFFLLPLIFLILNDMEPEYHGIHQQKAFRLFMFNPYYSAIGAVFWATGFLYFFFVFSISLLYLIHYLRVQIKQLLGQYHG